MSKYLAFLGIIFHISTVAQSIEKVDPKEVYQLAKDNALAAITPIHKIKEMNKELYQWGELLFFDKSLSGNKNISCAQCHDPLRFSGDGLPLGVGEGAFFSKKEIRLEQGAILKRHTPTLINLGRPEIRHYFWDGRVAKSSRSDALFTPEPAISGGANAKRKDITAALSGPLAAQALFPLADSKEMAGQSGENEIADLPTTLERWDAIIKERVLPNQKYVELFKKSFKEKSGSKLNIGHVGSALAEFQRFYFESSQTPFDQFMRGKWDALSQKELRGLSVYIKEAQCASCHNGEHLSHFEFDSSGAPQIGTLENIEDFGRQEASGRGRHRFMFKTTQLRNIALTAPYFHSGSVNTLEEVVDHYSAIATQLNSYKISEPTQDFYEGQLHYDNDKENNELRKLQVEGTVFQVGLKLTPLQRDDLIYFLRHSLTDKSFKERMESKLQKKPN
ncbi:MAG: hypothetical protein CME63_15250 [Halobacteriovoraceae bacterium]|nr:hypothetical protein [Halobacteriovoraceae bacterium]MBC99096.1 hypothetical protein [Halobacteriovoraceae bacterium]|tara:strand:- start:156151 stop:157494 length:1344 start_codon:yes stop_codon:yes gene_type:complete